MTPVSSVAAFQDKSKVVSVIFDTINALGAEGGLFSEGCRLIV